MAKPNKRLPERVVDIICTSCKTRLYKYHKNGKGSLVKCFKERIAKDFCDVSCICPTCGQEFAREQMIRGSVAYKIIGGKAKIS
ncbi:hypothetical protein [Pseudoalteromonas sp. G4]|uniref:hypothetical protein n=1 Tax=Pseudoalteromonas sp. G4 TaxID=2992761 RepID=UPI00237D670A|nr:hypothetical protein [Pseudoalteromonas sp. G4]MDE3270610.1 hypothetical protein [Pseudoalteromonas sp. G4]